MEKSARSEKISSIRRRIIGSTLGAILIIGCGWGVKERDQISDSIEDVLPDKSKIVAGVPVQVENGGYAHRNGGNWEYNLYVEQCQADIDAARRGEQAPLAIDERVGAIGAGCIGDYILVGAETYTTTPVGMIATFGGERDKFDLLRGHRPDGQ